MEHIVDVMKRLDTAPSRLSQCPRSQDRIPQRFVDRRRPQRAEQLVEVLTVVSHSSLQQQSAEQNVDIPVPGTRGEHGGLQGFHLIRPGWARSRDGLFVHIDTQNVLNSFGGMH